MGMAGAAGVLLGPLLKPTCLLARSLELPETYLQSSTYQWWMKLTYNNRGESREARRRMGVALRNLGSVRGKGFGYGFVSLFDQALERAYRRFQATGQKPASMFELIQQMYHETIYPQAGTVGGEMLFGTLFALLRGRDGSPLGEKTHESYLAYRAAALEHKNIYKRTKDPLAIQDARTNRAYFLRVWQQNLRALTSRYARGEAVLNAKVLVTPLMMDGFKAALVAVSSTAPKLSICPVGNHLMVSWKGGHYLQAAPSPSGPWKDARKASPATFDLSEARQFFRTVQAK